MVGIRWLPAANEARLLGDVSDVIPIAYPTGLWESQHYFIGGSDARLMATVITINRPEVVALIEKAAKR